MSRRINTFLALALAVLTVAAANPLQLFTAEDVREHNHKHAIAGLSITQPQFHGRLSGQCVDGLVKTEAFGEPDFDAGVLEFEGYECSGIDLLAYVPIAEFIGDTTLAERNPLTALEGSDIWGWEDPETAQRFVIMGKGNGAAFFNVTNPADPVYLGAIENTSAAHQVWFDIKVNDGWAWIVSESVGYGMLGFDLSQLVGVTAAQDWLPSSVYPLTGSTHNLVINEEADMAYLVGGNNGLAATDHCRAGLHAVDISTPLAPVFAGCYLQEGGNGVGGRSVTGDYVSIGDEQGTPVTPLAAYVHDAHCVRYSGPDTDHTGKDICVNSAENHLSIVDMTNPALPTLISQYFYEDFSYTHQGWFTEDQTHFLFGDELDESNGIVNRTRTYIVDMTDLDDPQPAGQGYHEAPYTAIDHNLYTFGGAAYQSNYNAGLRVMDLDQVADGQLREVAYFDVVNNGDDGNGDAVIATPVFEGTWSNYPYFGDGIVAVSAYDGLYMLQLHDDVLADITG